MSLLERIREFFRKETPLSQDEVDVVRMVAYQQGLAQGEIRGRLALANELAAMFHPDGQPFTPEDAQRVKARQIH